MGPMGAGNGISRVRPIASPGAPIDLINASGRGAHPCWRWRTWLSTRGSRRVEGLRCGERHDVNIRVIPLSMRDAGGSPTAPVRPTRGELVVSGPTNAVSCEITVSLNSPDGSTKRSSRPLGRAQFAGHRRHLSGSTDVVPATRKHAQKKRALVGPIQANRTRNPRATQTDLPFLGLIRRIEGNPEDGEGR